MKAIGVFAEHLPLLITDLGRQSLLGDPEVKRRFAEGAAHDGSRTVSIFVEQLSWQQEGELHGLPVIQLTLGAQPMRELLALLPYRLPYQQTFALVGEGCEIVLSPSKATGFRANGQSLQLALAPDTVKEICARTTEKEGIYDLISFPNLKIQVKKTLIKDRAGNVVETIG